MAPMRRQCAANAPPIRRQCIWRGVVDEADLCVAGTDNPVALRVITLTDTGKSGRRIRQCSDYLFLDFLFIQASPEMLEVAALGVE